MTTLQKWLRFMRFTLAWMFFFPFFFVGNRGLNRDPKYTWRCFKAFKYLKKGKVFFAWEYFWGTWNPMVTEETTKPLYHLVGGNRLPFISTMVVFLYSATILHNFCFIYSWMFLYKLVTTHSIHEAISMLSGFSFVMWTVIGISVATIKQIKAIYR